MALVSTLSANSPSIALKGNEMLISEYFEKEVSNKPYKYQTKLNMVLAIILIMAPVLCLRISAIGAA